jgi:hypothetical protein
MEEPTNGKMRKCIFLDEYGMMTVVYITGTLKDKTIDDIVSNCAHLQIVKYPDENYCLIPANEDVDLEENTENDMVNSDALTKKVLHDDILSQTDWRRVEGYTAQDYYMDNPDIFDGEIV